MNALTRIGFTVVVLGFGLLSKTEASASSGADTENSGSFFASDTGGGGGPRAAAASTAYEEFDAEDPISQGSASSLKSPTESDPKEAARALLELCDNDLARALDLLRNAASGSTGEN